KFNFSGKQPDYQPVLSGYQGTLDRWAKANLSGNYSDELATVRPMEACWTIPTRGRTRPSFGGLPAVPTRECWRATSQCTVVRSVLFGISSVSKSSDRSGILFE